METSIFSQESIKKDTLFVNDESMEAPVVYSAKDSIYIDAKTNQVHLYGEAQVNYDGVLMKAGYILIDLKKNEITASYRLDKEGKKVEYCEFEDGNEKLKAAKLRVNTETKKVYLEDAKIEQDEAFIYLDQGKRHENEQLHFKNGRFTTCDLEEPHFHFQLSRAILIPEKKIVTGPMNVWVRGIPTPFGLPFTMIPQQKQRKHGFLFPQIVPMSDYGFGVQDLGYYSPINDNIQTENYLTLYNRGSFGVKNSTQYLKNYKYNGSFDLGYQNMRMGFPSNEVKQNYTLVWNHNTDAKASPYWRFTSKVNFTSNNNSKTNLYQQSNNNYLNNQYNSDININRNFPGKPISMGGKIAFRQNTQTKSMALTSPTFNLNVNRFFPLKRFTKKDNAIARLGVVYRMDFMNQSTFGDSLLQKGQWDAIQKQFLNGANQAVSVQTTTGILKNKIKITPSLDYKTFVNFQRISKEYQTSVLNGKDSLATVFHQSTGYSQNLSVNLNATTVFYGYYRFVGKNKPLLRHIMTPNIGYSSQPKMNSKVFYTDTLGREIAYSPFERSAYTNYTYNSSSLLTFSLNNTFELKKQSTKDTTGFKKFKLVEQLSISGNYNFEADSMKLSVFNLSFRSTPFTFINFVSNANFSPYSWDSIGREVKEYAFNDRNQLGRFKSIQFTTTYTFTSKKSMEKIDQTKVQPSNNTWDADYLYYQLHPEQLINFEIPWKLNLSHVIGSDLTFNNEQGRYTYDLKHTVNISGDLSFTKRWKLSGNANFDIKQKTISYSRFELTRDMHCWGLSFMWVPTGNSRYFQFRIFATGSMLNGLQHTFTKPPLFF